MSQCSTGVTKAVHIKEPLLLICKVKKLTLNSIFKFTRTAGHYRSLTTLDEHTTRLQTATYEQVPDADLSAQTARCQDVVEGGVEADTPGSAGVAGQDVGTLPGGQLAHTHCVVSVGRGDLGSKNTKTFLIRLLKYIFLFRTNIFLSNSDIYLGSKNTKPVLIRLLKYNFLFPTNIFLSNSDIFLGSKNTKTFLIRLLKYIFLFRTNIFLSNSDIYLGSKNKKLFLISLLKINCSISYKKFPN